MPKNFRSLIVKTLSDSIIANFSFDPKEFLVSGKCCRTKFVDCVSKMTGVIRDKGAPINFIATSKFRIVMSESGLEAVINNINITDITLVGRYDVPPTSCGDFKIYYNINDPDTNQESDIIDDKNELIVYQVLSSVIENAEIVVLPDLIDVNFIFQTLVEPHVSYIEGGVVIGNQDACNKNFNKYSITGCKECPIIPVYPIDKIIIILLKILIFVIIMLILDPCCKLFLPKWMCKMKKMMMGLLPSV